MLNTSDVHICFSLSLYKIQCDDHFWAYNVFTPPGIFFPFGDMLPKVEFLS